MKNKTTSYLLRDIPPELKKRLKLRAVHEDTSIRRIILEAIEKYLQNKGG